MAVWHVSAVPLGMLEHDSCLMVDDGVDRDWGLTAVYYRIAADLGSSMATSMYGACLEEGLGVDLDLVLASHS
jgi:TPR repeat protein